MTTPTPPPDDPRAVLRSLGLRPRRSLSQSFLTDRGKLERIAAAAVPDGSWSVVEIGPGTGALTAELARRAARVLAVEADPDLAAAAAAAFSDRPHVEIRHGDARNLDLATLDLPRPLAVAGNIPYHLTGLLLRAALDADPPPDRVVFLVQLEVAARLVAAPGNRDYGALTVLCAAGWTARKLLRVPAGAFHPPPKVDSAVVLFERRAAPLCPPALRPAFRRVVLAAFGHRRQTLRNALRHGGLAPEELARLVDLPGVRLDHRPEQHPPEAFVTVAEALDRRPCTW
ncbi:MAG: ribosomal RNA small subunit methyltransferase A [Deltaproteobacteria bacterium]|nr:ribosomal RNA small subunit methyltransferase A [Deltaproteobacteria bacterium]